MKKPDRFQRTVDRIIRQRGYYPYIPREQIVKLLRREHAWVTRMVKKVDAWQAEQLADDEDAIAVILEQLQRRRA